MTTLKTGYEIKKLAGNLDSEVERGKSQIEIRKLQDLLIQSKEEILNNRESLREKDKGIVELEDLLKFKSKLVRKEGKYYESDENSDSIGDPLCSNCWQSEQKPIYLTQIEEDYFRCPKCKNLFGKRKPVHSSSGSY